MDRRAKIRDRIASCANHNTARPTPFAILAQRYPLTGFAVSSVALPHRQPPEPRRADRDRRFRRLDTATATNRIIIA